MHSRSHGPLDGAFEAAARVEDESDPALTDPAVRLARRILLARFASKVDEPCPPALRRQIEGCYGRRAWRAPPRLLANVFDSNLPGGRVVRGIQTGPRTMRFAGGGARVDIQIRTSCARGVVLHLAVNPACPGATVEIRMPRPGALRRALLDGDGTADISLPPSVRSVTLTVRRVGAEPFRIPAIEYGD